MKKETLSQERINEISDLIVNEQFLKNEIEIPKDLLAESKKNRCPTR